MKKRQGLLLGVLFSTQSIAQPLPPGITTVACDRSDTHCVAIGTTALDRDHCPFGCLIPIAFYSSDGKVTWTAAQSIPRPSLEMVYFASFTCSDDGMNCVAVGSQAHSHLYDVLPIIYTTIDGGIHWYNDNEVGSSYCSYHSSPWGSWGKLNDHTCDKTGKNCVAVGSCTKDIKSKYNYVGLSTISRDGGQTWHDSKTQPIPISSDDKLSKVACDDTGLKCKAIGTAAVYESDDGGDNWRLIK